MANERLFITTDFGRVPLFDGEPRQRLGQSVNTPIDTGTAKTPAEVISQLRDQLGGDETQMCLAATQALESAHETYDEDSAITFGEYARLNVHYAVIGRLCEAVRMPGLPISRSGYVMPNLELARKSAIDLAIYLKQRASQQPKTDLHPQQVGIVSQIIRNTDYQIRLFLNDEIESQPVPDPRTVSSQSKKIPQNCLNEFGSDQKMLSAQIYYEETGYLTVEDQIYRKQVKGTIFDRVEEILLSMKFDPERVDVLRLYAHDTTLKEIGARYGTTESRAFQVHKRAITLLRQYFVENGTFSLDLIKN